MSNIEKNLHLKPPVNFYQDQHQKSQQDINFKKSCYDQNERNFNTNKSAKLLNGNGIIKTEIVEKPYYQKKPDSEDISKPASNTILITTHSYSSQLPTATAKHLSSNNSSSSSITIVTTHNSSGSVSATTTTNNGGTTSIKSTGGDCITESYQNSLGGHSGNNSPVVLEGINILINNHFNEPSSSSNNNINNDSCNQSSNASSSKIININNKSIDIMDQKKHINSSTSATVNENIEVTKSEKSDIQTEPDSTTNGLSPDKSLTLKTSISNSDTGFSSSSSFCSSNSSNSSCTSNESTNNYKQQKVYNFTANMDVLVQKKDGKFYLGIIKDVYAVDGKCLVNFDDNSEYLADFDELKRLGSDSEFESSPMCVVCKKIDQNDIVETCEKCARGYHRMCAEGGYKLGIWTCKMCCTENGVKTPEKKHLCLSLSRSMKESNHISFSYNVKSLTWDNKHRINSEEIYCYCAKPGNWDNKMLQCMKCLQWFHEKCLKCLSYPLLFGDRFYVFACSVCNHGTEMLRRLKLSWVDLVHLLLFNLTKIENDKKYHHVTKVITPYAIQNWSNLQLSISMNNLSHKEIQKKIINVLSNSSRFKSGKETKKGLVYWGLRTRIPPAVPKIILPKGTTKITDQFLKSVLKLKVISPIKKLKRPTLESEDEPYLEDNDSKFSSDLKFSSEDEIPIKNIIEKELGTIKRENQEDKPKLDSPLDSGPQKEQSRRKKKSTFYPRLPNTLTIDKSDANGVANINNNVNISNNNINEKSVGSTADMTLCCDSSDDNSSLGPLDLRIPPPKNFIGRNNPFRQITPKKNQQDTNCIKQLSNNKKYNSAIAAAKLNLNAINHKNFLNDGNKSIDLSSKLVALKKSSVNLFNGGLPSDFQAAGQFRIVRTIKRRLSAKDLVIGPNQEIKRRRLRRSSGSGNVEVISTSIQSFSSSKSKNNILATYPVGSSFNYNTIPNLNTPPIYTSMNMPSSNSLSAYSSINSASGSILGSTTSNTPLAISPLSMDSNNPFCNFPCITNAQQLQQQRSLRKRDDKNYSENRRNSSSSTNNTTMTSNTATGNNIGCNIVGTEPSRNNNSIEQSTESELSDLQSSVNMYFGAVQRIRNGEKFIVRGKRTLSNGKIQYLMEWEGCAQGGQ